MQGVYTLDDLPAYPRSENLMLALQVGDLKSTSGGRSLP